MGELVHKDPEQRHHRTFSEELMEQSPRGLNHQNTKPFQLLAIARSKPQIVSTCRFGANV
eukprot:1040714-Amphidinium_carterae.1